jgi:hypothetical protein
MFERFTDRARRVVVLAQDEARLLRHNYIGTEHILLGLVAEGDGVAARALESLEIRLDVVRQQVEEIIGVGKKELSGHIPFTPRAKKVLELSLREALQLGHNYIGTEHILLGLIREGEGVAAQVLVRLGADLNVVRRTVISLAARAGPEPDVPRVPARARTGPRGDIFAELSAIAARLTVIEERLGIGRRTAAAAAEDLVSSGGRAAVPGQEAGLIEDATPAEGGEPGEDAGPGEEGGPGEDAGPGDGGEPGEAVR